MKVVETPDYEKNNMYQQLGNATQFKLDEINRRKYFYC